jgi:hypothetical protein
VLAAIDLPKLSVADFLLEHVLVDHLGHLKYK